MSSIAFLLKPNARLNQELTLLKARVKSIAGEQNYASHEPHLTLFLAEFAEPIDAKAIKAALPPIPNLDFSLKGLHVFEEHCEKILVCEVEENEPLKCLQLSFAEALAPFKSEKISPCWEGFNFSALEEENLSKYGAPFINSNWIPHLTIASLTPKAFDSVWPELKDDCPKGSHSFIKLQATFVRDFEQIGELFSFSIEKVA